jgi:PAS domain S-box-containing protein
MISKEIRVLHIEGDEAFSRRIRELLAENERRVHFTVDRAENLAAALKRLVSGHFDAVLTGTEVGAATAQELVYSLQKATSAPLIIIGTFPQEVGGVKFLRLGAQDCLIRDRLTSDELKRAILFAMERNFFAERLGGKVRNTQRFIDAMPTPIFFKDLNGFYLGCNTAWEQVAGKQREEIVGRKAREVFPTAVADLFEEMDKRVFQRPHVQVYETLLPFPDGSARSVIFTKAPYYSSDGKLEGLTGVVIDITDRKLSEEKYRTLVEGAELAIACFGPDGQVLFVNSFGARQIGCRPEDLIGRRLGEIFPRDMGEERLLNVREVIVRLRQGNVVVTTDDIWDALHAYELEKAKAKK